MAKIRIELSAPEESGEIIEIVSDKFRIAWLPTILPEERKDYDPLFAYGEVNNGMWES